MGVSGLLSEDTNNRILGLEVKQRQEVDNKSISRILYTYTSRTASPIEGIMPFGQFKSHPPVTPKKGY